MTPGSSATRRSTSRGTAMSTTSSGRAERRATTDDISSWSIDGQPAPVQVRTTSASASASASRRDGHDPAADAGGERGAPLGRAVGHDHLGDAAPASATATPSPISPAPTTSTLRPAQRPEALVGHLDRGVADRRRAPADPGLGAGPLADLERVAEQQVERRARRALPLRQLPCVADLAEDLGLAEHGRVEPGGHLEQVGDRGLVVLAVEVGAQLVGRQPGQLAEEVADVGVGAVEALGDGVDLGAVAGREHDDLADVRSQPQVDQRLGPGVAVEGDALEHVERRRAVVDPDDDDGHGCDSDACVAGPAAPARVRHSRTSPDRVPRRCGPRGAARSS